ncbi:hypothetical protein HMPREF9104_00391, partial [Lentilactobacillus kisonensis F0435]
NIALQNSNPKHEEKQLCHIHHNEITLKKLIIYDILIETINYGHSILNYLVEPSDNRLQYVF